MMDVPETRYTKSGDLWIAYQVFGKGPMDLAVLPGMWSNIELVWETRPIAHMYRRLSSFARVIQFDPRGSGLSDRGAGTETLEERMEDLTAVLDACGSERAALSAYFSAGPIAELFAGSHPERTAALVLLSTWGTLHPEWHVMGRRNWTTEEILGEVEAGWGGPVFWDWLAPSQAADENARKQWARFLRLTESPSSAMAQTLVALEVNLTPVLPSIAVPTLVLHQRGDRAIDVRHGRELAALIPNATYREFPGSDSAWWVGDVDALADEIEEFLTGMRPVREADRVVATVLFTDVVASTEKAAEVGDRSWRLILDRHNALVRRELARHRGREIKTVGDGFLATFDAPARAIRCAAAVRDGVRALGIDLRAGLHTGEVELIDRDVGGIGVHIGARVSTMAGPGEVLVSSTVKDLVVGSGIEFEDRGAHRLKGVPGEWRLFAAVATPGAP